MTRINELTKTDRVEFFNEIVKQHNLDHAISCVRDNNRLSECCAFHKTGNESYWRDLYDNGYPTVEMTITEIEKKLGLMRNTLRIIIN